MEYGDTQSDEMTDDVMTKNVQVFVHIGVSRVIVSIPKYKSCIYMSVSASIMSCVSVNI